jgi:outer membrane protein OmpA-like peptidoglycan-associated protein/LysM repeat protein
MLIRHIFVNMKKIVVFILVVLLVSFYSDKASAQKKPVKKSKPNPTLILADKHYNNLEYYLAAHEYARVLKNDSSNAYAMFQLAECYRLFFDYKGAEGIYHKVASRHRDKYPLARFWYATMLKDNGNYKKAIDNFEKYREEHTDTDLETELYREKASQEIKGCYIAIEENDKPKKDYGFKCLPKPVNSHESDYSPVIFENDTFLTLTSSRRGSVGGHKDNSLGGAFTDVYRFQKESDTLWNVVKHSHNDEFNKLNTQYNESSGSFTGDEKKYYFTRCDEIVKVDNYEEFNCAIYVSYNKTGQWEKPVRLNENINTPGQWNSQPSISPDGNILFFVSKRPGGLGLHDIWYSTCNGDDQWGPPINLGDKINTLFIDVSPRYYADQKVLFFSSNGHGGHGGLDIFMTKEEDGFQNIINLGFPFNSNRDDFYFVMGEKKGYITSNREGGVGNDDVYTFNIKTKKSLIHQIEDSTATEEDDTVAVVAKVPRDEHISDIPIVNDGTQSLEIINGQVIDSTTNAPSKNVEVNLIDEHGDVIAKSITNESGQYNFNNLPTNKEYKVVLKNPDHKTQSYVTPPPQIQYTKVAIEPVEPAVPRQELISKVTKDNSTTPKMLAISGVLTDSISKKPVPNTEVQVLDEVGNVLLTTNTNEKGEYKFENLPSNSNLKVVLINSNPKEKAYIKTKPVLQYKAIPEQLVSKEAVITTISKDDQVDKKSFVVQGVIIDAATNKPVTKGQVQLIDEFGNVVQSVNVDANGKYKIENVAGNKDYKVVYKTTTKATSEFITTTHKVTHIAPTNVPTTTEALIATIDKDVLPDAKSMSVDGAILYEDNRKAAPNVTILLVDENGSTLKTTKTDKNGVYKFSNLPTGRTYKIILQQGNLKGSEDKKYFAEKVNIKGSEAVASKHLFENIYFDFDSYTLRNEAQKVLDDLAEYCKNDPSIQIELYANTDSYGTSQYNKILAAKRGKVAMDYLISKGLTQSSMVVNAIGENKSIASNDTELGRQLNRRVEFYILGATKVESRAMAYVIEPKKTLFSLAKEYNMTVAELKELNGLVGDELVAYTPIRVKRRGDDNDIIAPATRQQAYSSKREERVYNKTEQELIAKNKKLNQNFDYNKPEYKKYVDSMELADKKNGSGANRYEGANIVYYITQPKNTLYNIARLYGVNVEGLKTLNNLSSDTIYIGQKIKIDFNQKDPSIRGYVVKEGDTIGEIAKRFGLSINELLEINNLDGYILRKNMILRLKKE